VCVCVCVCLGDLSGSALKRRIQEDE
jgi:hypothetical protein